MANTVAPFGFKPLQPAFGGSDLRPNPYVLTTGSTIFKGDPVIITSAGTVSVSAAGQTTTHCGIAADYVSDSGSAGGKIIYVWDNPFLEFIVQVNTGVTVTGQTNVFNTADHITMAAGNTVSKQSVMALDTIGTSALPWMILRLWDVPNNAWGDSAIVVVKYQVHYRMAACGSAI